MTKNNESTKPSHKNDRELEAEFAAADYALEAGFNASSIIAEYSKFKYQAKLPALRTLMLYDIQAIKSNDLSICEGMLYAQANALQTIFTELSIKAINRENIKFIELYLKYALKAQNQCRMTLETLSNVKNPPVIYAKQANINHGNQQVNNGLPSHENSEFSSHTTNKGFKPNELLEEDVNEQKRLDGRKACKTIRDDSSLAAMEPINRPKIRRRKKTLKP